MWNIILYKYNVKFYIISNIDFIIIIKIFCKMQNLSNGIFTAYIFMRNVLNMVHGPAFRLLI